MNLRHKENEKIYNIFKMQFEIMHNLSWSSSQRSVSIVRDNDEFWIRTVQGFESSNSSFRNAKCMTFWNDLSKWGEMKLNPICQYILINIRLLGARPQAYLYRYRYRYARGHGQIDTRFKILESSYSKL